MNRLVFCIPLLTMTLSVAMCEDKAPHQPIESAKKPSPFEWFSKTGDEKWLLLSSPPVIDELELSEDASRRLAEARKTMAKIRAGLVQDPNKSPRETRVETDREVEKVRKVYLKQVDAILSPQQQARLQEIYLQRAGVAALSQDDVSEKLKLSDEQRAKILDLLDLDKTKNRPALDGAKRQEIAEQIIGILNDEQRAEWDKMKGKEFDFGKLEQAPK